MEKNKKINIYTEDRKLQLKNQETGELFVCYAMFSLNEFGERYIVYTDGFTIVQISKIVDDNFEIITDDKELEIFEPYVEEFLLNNQIKTLDGKKLLTESIEEAYEANVGPIDEDIN